MSAKRDSPSAQRNKGPIWEVLSTKVLSSFEGSFDKPIRILEIAAGCGVHTDHFVSQLSSANKHCDWFPTDPSEDSLQSIQCYIDEGKFSDSIQSPVPLTLDATGIMETSTASKFDEGSLDLIMCINMIHISPWSATLGLMKVAGEKLSDDGSLYCYGPYKVGGTAVESNLSFDRNLKSRNPSWGVRDLEAVCKAANDEGLELVEKIEMPANNLSLIFRKK